MGANPAANSPTFQRNSKPYTKYACIFFIQRMSTAVQLEMLYKTTSCHDFKHTVFKVLKGHPKDIDVEGERSEKNQGWALSAFIKVCEA